MSRRTVRIARTVTIRLALAAALLATLTGAGPALARQQDATATPDIPQPDECRVEPRPLPLFPETPTGGAAATPAVLATVTPVALPTGEPADEATVAAITATVREAVACRNAGDFGRAYALVSDRFLGQLFGGPDTIPPEVATALEEGADRVPRANRLGLVAVAEVAVLDDGRVGAVVESRNARERLRDYLLFVRASDRWLIDEQIALPEPGAATATPERGG